MTQAITEKSFIGSFRQEIEKHSEQDFARCYQCGKCTAGCPMTSRMDLMPNQIMREVQLNLKDMALSCRTIWLCASCETCTTRCPQQIDIARIMDTLRERALAEKTVHPEAKEIANFHKVFLSTLRLNGKLFEAGMVGMLRALNPSKAFDDLGVGIKMFLKGKLKPLPSRVKGMKSIRRIYQGKGK